MEYIGGKDINQVLHNLADKMFVRNCALFDKLILKMNL